MIYPNIISNELLKAQSGSLDQYHLHALLSNQDGTFVGASGATNEVAPTGQEELVALLARMEAERKKTQRYIDDKGEQPNRIISFFFYF